MNFVSVGVIAGTVIAQVAGNGVVHERLVAETTPGGSNHRWSIEAQPDTNSLRGLVGPGAAGGLFLAGGVV
eukprot:CAMPEP_0117004074 /NCGR_PEP_ID=MMETSP0472-20121206/5178_1 /TAXON_ID=693140 ORGANISM="Tiarina fusus, Strain LIS" /NCGR_SAMPLE_ID=MMETSP0472 /ASSEMBLY_ACC=CAM_ASM_000603 /LENGTH=70 /DNA_ID=CAMNT_0004704927 /DNA_START=581 /DNA_END=790 /DNA_ORIENTATION=+